MFDLEKLNKKFTSLNKKYVFISKKIDMAAKSKYLTYDLEIELENIQKEMRIISANMEKI